VTAVRSRPLEPAESLRGTLTLPSDKSIAHRALICAALASGVSEISLRDPGADVQSTVRALRSLGTRIRTTSSDEVLIVEVDGSGDQSSLGALAAGIADCGNSGTSMRLLMGAAASSPGRVALVGDESLMGRPMARVADPLRAMGADVDLERGHAPVIVRGHRPLRPIEFILPVASAQVLGAVSLAALSAHGTTTVRVPGVVRDHTERMLSALGVDVNRLVEAHGTSTTINGPAQLGLMRTRVQGDMSSAAAWLVAGAIHGNSQITLSDLGLNPTRTAIVDVLRAMGAQIDVNEAPAQVIGEPVGEIVVRGGRQLHAVSLGTDDVAPLIDELPLLAITMAAADGTSEVRGASELRVKESDRIAAIGAALTAAGANFEELEDGWRVSRGTPQLARVVTHGDHRIAIAMAVAAWTGVAASVELDDPDCVAVSYPTFWGDASLIGASS